MIAYIALILSVINSILWVVFAVGIRKVFKRMLPLFQSFGIAQSQNLIYSPVSDRIGGADEIGNAESESNTPA